MILKFIGIRSKNNKKLKARTAHQSVFVDIHHAVSVLGVSRFIRKSINSKCLLRFHIAHAAHTIASINQTNTHKSTRRRCNAYIRERWRDYDFFAKDWILFENAREHILFAWYISFFSVLFVCLFISRYFRFKSHIFCTFEIFFYAKGNQYFDLSHKRNNDSNKRLLA